MIIESMRPVLAVGTGFIAALLILFFGNKVRPNVREAITIIASVVMASFVFSMVPEVLNGNYYICKLWTIVDGIELFMPLENLVDMEKEKQRKQEEKKKIEAEIERAEKMLSNPGFVNKAPAAKIQEEREKLEKYKEMLKKFE